MSRGDGCYFGTVSAAAVWRATRIPAIPVLTKTKSRLYCEYQRGEFSSRPPRHTKSIPGTALHHEILPVRLPLMLPFYSKCSVITRLTLCVSSIIIKLGGLWRWEIGWVQLGASRILVVIYSTLNGRPSPLSFDSCTGAKYIFLSGKRHWRSRLISFWKCCAVFCW